eukprot:599688-Amphidinium_carterae.1
MGHPMSASRIHTPCHGEVIAVFIGAAAVKQKRDQASQCAHAIPESVPLLFPQDAINRYLAKAFPAEWVDGIRYPCIEDLVNTSPFIDFAQWLKQRPHQIATNAAQSHMAGVGWQASALGSQAGAMSSHRALPALIAWGLEPNEHFRSASELATTGILPFDASVSVATDLRFAAIKTLERRRDARTTLHCFSGALKELSRRCHPLTTQLLKHQPPT